MKPDDKYIIAIDPGREKCGIAVLRLDKITVLHQIIMTEALTNKIAELQKNYEVDSFVIGSGTTSKNVRQQIESLFPAIKINIVNEYRTTDEAKKRYWSDNPPKGLKRLIPLGMLVPPVPVDDLAAVIIGEKYLSKIP